jgi:hypothetical protein
MFAKGKRKPSGPNRFAALQNSDEDEEDSGSKSIDNNSLEGASAEAAGIVLTFALNFNHRDIL